MHFGNPWALLLLLALPVFTLLARRSRSGLEKGRSIASTILRSLVYAALVLALADAHWISRTWRTATIFLVDHSYSVPQDVQKQAIEWVNERIKEMPKDDVGGAILFGTEAMIEVPPGPKPALIGPHSIVTRTATDIGAALRLALAIFPQGYQRRIVLLSDGNENRGHALAEAESVRAHGAVIDVLPLKYDHPNEAWIEGFHVPPDILPREPFEVTVVVNAQGASPATLNIYRNNELLSQKKVQLVRGKNVFTVKQKVEAAGAFAYRATIEMASQDDTVSQNNVGHAFAHARGQAKIGIVGGEPVDAQTLATALAEEGLQASVLGPDDILRGLSEIGGYDALILANVEAAQLGRAGMQAIEAAVHDTGVGLIMIGGERSYGPGGYRGTPIEEMLPVTMEQPQRRVLPNGALCLVLHTCEISEGNYWAKQIGIAALKVLGPQDYMGVLIYGGGGEQWLFQMQLVKDRPAMAKLIEGASPGDMPSFDITMQMAHVGLKPLPAASKHVVVISDADPSGPSKSLVDAMIQDRITITTVAIGPHGSSDVDKMKGIAERAKGRFYFVQDPATLPQIFIKEAATLQRSMVIEGRVVPSVTGYTDALKGIGPDEYPALLGYTLTSLKPKARMALGIPPPRDQVAGGGEQFDPLLAEWMHGLGRAMAFTSDAKPRWAKEWVAWEKYRKFWSQAVRSVLRTVPRAPYTVQTEIEGGRGKVTVDAMDEQGRFIHSLRFGGSVTSPEGRKLALPFRQVGPGRYEAEFEAPEVGVYSVNGSFEGAHGEKGFIVQGVPLSYPPEYRDLKTNLSLLNQLQGRTNGRMLGAKTPVYEPLPVSSGVSMPLWPWLLMLLLALFPIDIFIRRVAVEWGPLFASLRWHHKARVVEAPAMLQALARKKQEVRLEQFAPPSSPVDLKAPSGTPAAPPPAQAGPAPAKPEPPPSSQQADYMRRLLDAKRKAKPKE